MSPQPRRRPSSSSTSDRSPVMPSSSSTDPARIHPNPGRSTDPPDPPLTLLHPTVSPAQVDRQPHPRPHSHSQPPSEPQFDVRDSTRTSLRQSQRKKGPIWKRLVKGIGSGMRNDVRNRAPYYWSDWTDAWNYRVVPATWASISLAHVAWIHEHKLTRSSSSLRTYFQVWRSPWTSLSVCSCPLKP